MADCYRLAGQSRLVRCMALLGMLMCCSLPCAGETATAWWDSPYATRFAAGTPMVRQDLIRVEGNGFVDAGGKPFKFRGASIADPDKLLTQGQWSPEIFQQLRAWGANTVRIPVHPIAWRKQGREAYLRLLDDAVRWANAASLYVIVDWHSIGYLPNGLFQHVIYETSEQETLAFWRDIAFRYQGLPTVAVYELFNEPTTQGGTLGEGDWLQWKAFNERLIDLIRARDATVIPLVAGFNWAYDLGDVAQAPIARDGVAYAVHPYPQKAKPDRPSRERFFALWQQQWGFASEHYPVIASELGWVRGDGYGAHIPVINDGSYGPLIIDFMQTRGISWLAWCFDPDWSPVLIEDWNYHLSEQGEFFHRVLNGEYRLGQ